MILFIVLISLGVIVGFFDSSPIVGGFIGFLGAWVHQLANKLQALRDVVDRQGLSRESQEHTQSTSEAVNNFRNAKQTDWVSGAEASVEEVSIKESQLNSGEATDAIDSVEASQARDNAWSQAADEKVKAEQVSKKATPSLLSKAFGLAKDWFIGGNPFVRAGIVLLFIGVVFLLRYSLEQGLIPVELRLAGAAAAALVLLFFGWRLRDRAGAYGLILQAGGIGLLYLTVFGAFSLYGLIAAPIAFGLLVVVVAAGVMLAVLQNSLALAMFATAGGFLAPLLTSTGSNNYIGLFSFYALLNIGIVTISWFKSWRLLNLLGFVFTFVIASIWGLASYQSEFFSTTEPFLILFFLIYVAIAVLFAIRTPVNYKDSVDSTLVFGVPVIGFGMQVALVNDFEYGVAISALVLGLFYLLLSKVLWKRYGKPQKLLVETFVSLGVIFATLSIPFAVDGALTSATWAIEGVGILWVSIRQQQWIRRAFAIFLHFAALIALSFNVFLDLFSGNVGSAFANGNFIALLLITVSMLVCSRMLSRDFEGKRPYETVMSQLMFFIAILLQWLAFCFEIVKFGLLDEVVALHLGYSIIVSVLLCLSMYFKTWRLVKYVLPLPLILMSIAALKVISSNASLTMDHGIALWPLALAAFWGALYMHQKQQRFTSILKSLHSITIWLVAVMLSGEVHYWATAEFGFSSAWTLASLPLVILAIIWLILSGKVWPIKDFRDTLLKTVAIPFAGIAGLWVMLSLGSSGSAAPLPWVPVLNPLDIIVALTGLTLYKLYRELALTRLKEEAEFMRYSAVFVVFMAINVTVLRVLHHFYDYAWQFPSLLQQPVTQTTLAIVWTLFGMTLAWRGNRVLNRKLWFAGAALLGLVVLKLFIVDFASSGTLARVISFISVGGLLLFIGYLAPMPSTTKLSDEAKSEKETTDV